MSLKSVVKDEKSQNNLVVRIDQDSNDNLQELFDTVLNPSDSKRPLQVPLRMRKLPNSFFNPPAVNTKNDSVSHSRANSADSAYDAGSQPSINQGAANISQKEPAPPAPAFQQSSIASSGMTISHSRAHSSPASLQQTYNIHTGGANSTGDIATELFAISSLNCPSIQAPNRTNQMIQQFHAKQRSYDIVSPIQLQNELGELPAGWEQAKTHDGQIYYLNHITKSTQWEDPRIKQQQAFHEEITQSSTKIDMKQSTLPDSLGPLPEGWEQAFTDSGDVYFINHNNRTTSWNDPRIPEYLQKPIKGPKADELWVNMRQSAKPNQQKPDQKPMVTQSGNVPMDPFLSGDNHTRQESSDSGLSLSSNKFVVQSAAQMDESDGDLNLLNGLDSAHNLVSSLQLDDDFCGEIFDDVDDIMSSSSKSENLEWYQLQN